MKRRSITVEYHKAKGFSCELRKREQVLSKEARGAHRFWHVGMLIRVSGRIYTKLCYIFLTIQMDYVDNTDDSSHLKHNHVDSGKAFPDLMNNAVN